MMPVEYYRLKWPYWVGDWVGLFFTPDITFIYKSLTVVVKTRQRNVHLIQLCYDASGV